MSADLAPYLKRIVIYVKHNFAPARPRLVAGRKKLVYSDHFPLLVEFENLPQGWISKDIECSWNQKKPGGWERYEALTEAASKKMDSVIEDEELSIEEISDKIEKIETKIKFQAFGKTKPPTKLKTKRRLEAIPIPFGGMEQEEEKANKILKNQLQELEDDINN